jgi:hypothetical protein
MHQLRSALEKHCSHYAEFEVLTVIAMNSANFWDVTTRGELLLDYTTSPPTM